MNFSFQTPSATGGTCRFSLSLHTFVQISGHFTHCFSPSCRLICLFTFPCNGCANCCSALHSRRKGDDDSSEIWYQTWQTSFLKKAKSTDGGGKGGFVSGVSRNYGDSTFIEAVTYSIGRFKRKCCWCYATRLKSRLLGMWSVRSIQKCVFFFPIRTRAWHCFSVGFSSPSFLSPHGYMSLLSCHKLGTFFDCWDLPCIASCVPALINYCYPVPKTFWVQIWKKQQNKCQFPQNNF